MDLKSSKKSFGEPSTSHSTIYRNRRATPSKQETEKTPKPVLSSAELLDIIDRVEKGQFKPGEGVAQFYKSEPLKRDHVGSRRNLCDLFDKLGVEETVGPGAPAFSSTVLSSGHSSEKEELSPYIRFLQRFMAVLRSYRETCNRISDRQAAVIFHQYFPEQRIVTLMRKVEETNRLLNQALRKPVLEQSKLFQVQLSAAPPSQMIHIDLETQRRFIEILTEFKDLKERIGQVHVRQDEMFPKVKSLEGMNEKLLKLLSGFESAQKEWDYVYKMVKSITFDDEASGGSDTSGIETDGSKLESLFASPP